MQSTHESPVVLGLLAAPGWRLRPEALKGFIRSASGLPRLESGPAEAHGGGWGGARQEEGCWLPPAESHHQLSHTEVQKLSFTVPTSGSPFWPGAAPCSLAR